MASELLGMQSLCRDFGIELGIKGYLGATAGIAIGSRRGFGNVQHIDTVFLWAQDLTTEGKLILKKLHTSKMLADFVTKPFAVATLNKCIAGLGFVRLGGRHSKALKAQH